DQHEPGPRLGHGQHRPDHPGGRPRLPVALRTPGPRPRQHPHGAARPDRRGERADRGPGPGHTPAGRGPSGAVRRLPGTGDQPVAPRLGDGVTGRPSSGITLAPWKPTMPQERSQASRWVLSLIPKNGFGWARTSSRSSSGSTVIWSSPPIAAIAALMPGSANAACRSSARCRGVEPMTRVAGYSTGSSPYSSRSRRRPSSNGSGNTPARPEEGDSTAIRSPGTGFGGYTASIME